MTKESQFSLRQAVLSVASVGVLLGPLCNLAEVSIWGNFFVQIIKLQLVKGGRQGFPNSHKS